MEKYFFILEVYEILFRNSILLLFNKLLSGYAAGMRLINDSSCAISFKAENLGK